MTTNTDQNAHKPANLIDQAWSFSHWQKKMFLLAKRGNLESELLLLPYIEHLSAEITQNDKILLEALLNESDQSLFYWLISTPPALEKTSPATHNQAPLQYQMLIRQIRDNYLNFNQ